VGEGFKFFVPFPSLCRALDISSP